MTLRERRQKLREMDHKAIAVMMFKFRQRFRAVIYPSQEFPGQWCAHCLELDLVTQGTNQGEVLVKLNDAMNRLAHKNLKEGRSAFKFWSAPSNVWQMFDRITEDHGGQE